MSYAEPLFLVNYYKSELGKFNVIRKDAVRSYQNISVALISTLDSGLLFLFRAKARKEVYLCRKGGKPFGESLEMLISEHRRGSKDRDLPTIHHGLECGPHCNFGLPIPNVAYNQTIHRRRRFHIFFDVRDRGSLIDRQVVRKSVFKFSLPGGIRRKGMTANKFSFGIKTQKLVRHVSHRPLSLCFGLLPTKSAKTIERRCSGFTGRVSGN